MAGWRTPLLLAGTLMALSASAPSVADSGADAASGRPPGDVSVHVDDDVSVRVGDDSVCVDVPTVSVRIGQCGKPAAKPRPTPTERVRVVIGTPPRKPPRKPPHRPARPARHRVVHPVRARPIVPQPVRATPKPVEKPAPTPTPTPSAARPRVKHAAQPVHRKNPLGTVLLMVVLTTVIASTAAVAFGAVR